MDLLDGNLEAGRSLKVAIRTPDRDLTYAEVVAGANRVGNALRGLGVRQENRVLLAVAVLAGSIGWIVRDRAERRSTAENKILEAVSAAEPGLEEGNPWAPEVVTAVRQVDALLASAAVRPDVQRQAEQLLADQQMLQALEQIRLDQAEVKEGSFDTAGADEAYARAKKILTTRHKDLEAGTQILLEKETITPEDFKALLPAKAEKAAVD